MEYLSAVVAHPLGIFARAGGGGSSSGGSGGGFGIALVGYIPMHFLGAKLRRRSFHSDSWVVFQVIGWTVCALYCIALLFVGFWGIIIGAGAILGTGAGLYNWFSFLKRNKTVEITLQRSAQADPVWNEASIVERATSVFYAYQADWTARDWQAMTQYMTPRYAKHSSLMIAALLQAHRVNDVQNPTVIQAVVTNVVDSANNDEDVVTLGFVATAKDRLVDDQDGSVLFTDTNQFTEYWQFRRQGDTWLLDGIQQATAAGWLRDSGLQAFAEQNGYFYSLDWGWLLLPRRGRLFDQSKFGTSDINNHIIGVYNQYYLLQLYTYVPNPKSTSTYLIAQTNLPKAYGDIVVRRKKAFRYFAPRGLRHIAMEWGDFNKKYDVFASTSEGPTSFELLHPAFMETLEALPFEVNIEVVDNVVYLYTPQKDKTVTPDRYVHILEALREAYKQMKL